MRISTWLGGGLFVLWYKQEHKGKEIDGVPSNKPKSAKFYGKGRLGYATGDSDKVF